MSKKTSIFGALAIAVVMATGSLVAPAVAQEEEAAGEHAAAAGGHESIHVERQPWSFGGVFGTYDEHQLQRGFQVFREVCSNCHSARLLAFRNLEEEGGPGYSDDQIKALAATYQVQDEEAEGGRRAGVPADHWPSPFANDQEARDANGGALPPDFSVLAKARTIESPFPMWILNYFTAYAEGGPDYIHGLLNGYTEAPEGFDLPDGKYYNAVFPGHAIGMAPPLADGLVTYEQSENGESVPETLEQYSTDVAAFLMWVAEPHLASRKAAGMQVILFLIVFAGILYLVKRKLWANIEH